MADPGTERRATPAPAAGVSAQALAVVAALILALVPVALGGYPEWARHMLATVLFLLLAAMLAGGILTGRSQVLPTVAALWVPAGLFILLLGYFLAQSVAIGPGFPANPAWARLTAPEFGQPTGHISVAPDRTFARAVDFAAYGAWALVCTCIALHRRAVRIVTVGLVVTGAVHGSLALVWHFLLPERILWLERWLHTDLTGFFFNRNHAACFFGILLFVVLGEIARWARLARAAQPRLRRGVRATTMMLVDALNGYAFLLVSTAGLLLVCIALAQSRGAVAGIAVGLVVFAVALQRTQRDGGEKRLRGRTVALGIIGAGGVVALLGYGVLFARYESEGLDSGRWEFYGPILEAIGDHAWFGAGFGGFEAVFHAYRPEGMRQFLRYAHSDYLELALEVGLPAAGVFALLVLALVARVARAARTLPRERRIGAVVALAVLGQLAVHELVEFNLAIPAIVLLATWVVFQPIGRALGHGWGLR